MIFLDVFTIIYNIRGGRSISILTNCVANNTKHERIKIIVMERNIVILITGQYKSMKYKYMQ